MNARSILAVAHDNTIICGVEGAWTSVKFSHHAGHGVRCTHCRTGSYRTRKVLTIGHKTSPPHHFDEGHDPNLSKVEHIRAKLATGASAQKDLFVELLRPGSIRPVWIFEKTV